MMVYGGISFAHLREMALAALKVVALLSPGTVFHIFAIMFEARLGNPGTGRLISFEDCDLVETIIWVEVGYKG